MGSVLSSEPTRGWQLVSLRCGPYSPPQALLSLVRLGRDWQKLVRSGRGGAFGRENRLAGGALGPPHPTRVRSGPLATVPRG